ncbi:MAG: hypothetical protein ACRETF_05675 [Nevskiaceae bacterium]
MARTAAKKQPPAKVEEDDDTDGWEDAVVEADGKEAVDLRLRDWRDVERFREMKELRNMVDDDYGLEEIFHVPLKPRVEVPPRQPKSAAPARLVPASKAPLPKPKAAKAVHAPAPAKPAPKAKLKVTAKPKRR